MKSFLLEFAVMKRCFNGAYCCRLSSFFGFDTAIHTPVVRSLCSGYLVTARCMLLHDQNDFVALLLRSDSWLHFLHSSRNAIFNSMSVKWEVRELEFRFERERNRKREIMVRN